MKIGGRVLGPNMSRFLQSRMAQQVIDEGNRDVPGVARVVSLLADPKGLANCALAALKWCDDAVDLVRGAAEPNEWRNADAEAIAAEINRRVAAQRQAGKARVGA